MYFYGRLDVSGQVGRDAGRQLTDFVSYLSWIGRVAVLIVNLNKNTLYRHSRAGGNPVVGFSGIDRKGLLCDGLDSRLRGNDDGRHFLF